MRVLLVTQYFPPEMGATQTRLQEMARAFLRAGHEVTVICEFPNHPHGVIPEQYRGKRYCWEEFEGYRILRTWVSVDPEKTTRSRMGFYLSFMAMASLAGFKRLGRIDLVLASSPPLPVALAGHFLSVLRGAPLVLDIRDLWPDAAVALGELRNPLVIRVAKAVERFLYRRARLITSVTRGYSEEIIAEGADPAKLISAPNGTLPSLYGPDRVDPDLRKRLGLGDRFVVTFAGLMGLSQGLDFLLDLAMSYRDDPRIAFLLIGDGPRRQHLGDRIKAEGLDNVVLHPQVPLEEITPYLNASDLLLVTLRDIPDAFFGMVPIKLYDYLACKPPLLVAVPGKGELPGQAESLLTESGGGVTARPEDLASFRKAIEAVREDPAAAREMGEAGQRFVLPRFARESVMDGMVEAITDHLDRRG